MNIKLENNLLRRKVTENQTGDHFLFEHLEVKKLTLISQDKEDAQQ